MHLKLHLFPYPSIKHAFWVLKRMSQNLAKNINGSVALIFQVNLAIEIPNITKNYINSHIFTCQHWVLQCLLAHLSRRLRSELLVYQWLRRPSSVRQHFQTSSPLKPLGQLNSNFICRLLRIGERKFVQMILVTWPRWPPCPYMVKTL